MKTHFLPDDATVNSSENFQIIHEEPSDAEISSLGSDKWFKPDHSHPDDDDFKSEDRPSTSSSTRSRSDIISAKFKPDTEACNKGQRTKPKEPKGIGASSSGLSPEERARSLLLPTIDEAKGSVPRERSEGQDPGEEGQGDEDSIPSTIEYPEHPSTDLVIVDDRP